ncbi:MULTISPECIES: tripartite tricarboxylate transporter TctB family protein [Roseobacteraceae]|uniref:Tripartite tricarboxylate transporter TctB family protein n=1 Tax=Pseudosulfitobacter pseudonitzschiae TaxID=1402135 RepID=A0A221K2I7_9RHOB|nr:MULTISPECIES: tripartite tricarboxylate transporter TctB family protein [Roseobacteraceae]ASM73057.1 tripartite tricarboxylate transporter TctB family protein [Pseudosulfitobacter pseudonitzschiae]
MIARLLSYVFLFAASGGLFISATAIPASRFEKLGAGAFPKIVFAAMVLMSALAVIDALRQIPLAAYRDFSSQTQAWVKRRYLVFVSLAALTVYLLAIPLLGFSIASFAFLFGLQLVLMPRQTKSIVIAAVVALVFSFGLNWLFAEVFTVFLPRGVL